MARIRTRAHTRRAVVGAVLFLVLAVGGGLLAWGGNFGSDMVHDLAAHWIFVPDKGTEALNPEIYPGLQQYAGEAVDSGPKAKADANEYITVHLNESDGGETYSELSAASRANPADTSSPPRSRPRFRGETLRGLLLYAWGWSVVASIATLTAYAAFIGAAVVLVALVYGPAPSRARLIATERRSSRWVSER